MENYWVGNVALHDDDPNALEEIRFSGKGSNQYLPSDAKLTLLSFVDRTRVPLHIVCGQPCNVQFSSTWLRELLVDALPQDPSVYQEFTAQNAIIESDIGALIRVSSDDLRIKQSALKITELLIYASCDKRDRLDDAPRSPNGRPLSIKVDFHAIPLSSHLLYQPSLFQLPATPPPEELPGEINGTFLRTAESSGSKKRRRLDNLFEDATKPKRNVQRQDSQDLSRLVPPSGPQSPALSHADSTTSIKPANRSHSRTGSLSLTQPDRPRSQGYALERARSSLSRVASTGILSASASRGATVDPCPQDDRTNLMESKNKKSLSNIVMASMRLRGMSQNKADIQGPDDADYKLMYHNTFKAANFALRGKMRQDLNSEAMRDVVDLLLDLFCGDGDNVNHHGFG